MELVQKDTTSKILNVFVRDSTTGQGKTGIAAGSMSGEYTASNAAAVALSFSTGAIGDSYSSGKWAEGGNGNYKYHAPNGMLDAFGFVRAIFQAAGAIDAKVDLQIVAFDPTDIASLGMTNLNATVASRSSHDAAAIRTELSTELGRIDATIASRSSHDAAAIRTELSTELGRIDENVSAAKTLSAAYDPAKTASQHNAAAVAALILSTPANLLDTDASGHVTAGTVGDKTGYSLSQAFPANFADLDVEVSTGKVTTANPAAGGGSNHTAADVAALILSTPANLLDTDASGNVTVGTNSDKTGYTIAGTIQDLDSLDGNQDAQHASTQAAVSAVAGYVDTEVASVKAVTDKLDSGLEADGSGGFQFTALSLENGPSGGGGGSTHDAADVAALILATPANKLTTDASGHVTAGTVGDKTGYSLSQAFPTNFADLAVEVTTGKVTTANPAAGSGSSHTAADVAALILETPANKLVTDGSGYVSTGSNYDKTGYTIAGSVQDLDSIYAEIISAKSEVTDGQASYHASLSGSISGLDSQHTTTQALLATVAGYVDTEVASVKAVTDKLDSGLEADGSGGFQWTVLSMDNAPQGSGGGGSTDEAAIIAGVLVGLSDVVTISQPVSTTGQITEAIVIGDDYLASHSRAFEWTVAEVAGIAIGDVVCKFGLHNARYGGAVVTGTATDNGDGTWLLSFDVTKDDTAALTEGAYEWSVEVSGASGQEITRVRNADDEKATLIGKQT